MAQRCKVCALPQRHTIDLALVQHTETPGSIARQYALTESSVRRHQAAHLPKMLATLATRVDALSADVILAQLVNLYERGLEALDDAESMAHDADRAKAMPALIREARANLEALAKVSVALSDARSTEVVHVENTLEREIRDALDARRKAADGNSRRQRPSQAHELPVLEVEAIEAGTTE